MAGERDPCPYRILDDIGGAFVMGMIYLFILFSYILLLLFDGGLFILLVD
jgi:hypothetical protein